MIQNEWVVTGWGRDGVEGGGDGVGTPKGKTPKGKTPKGKMLENACFRSRRAHIGRVAGDESRGRGMKRGGHIYGHVSGVVSDAFFRCILASL